MAYIIRVLINRSLQEGDGGAVAQQVINEGIRVTGELTEIDAFRFNFHWKEGTRIRASSAGTASIFVGRRLENTASDLLADTLLAGPKLRGDPQVFPLRVYEIDNTRHGWDSVVNEWVFERAVITASAIQLEIATQTIMILGTDIQLVPHRGKYGSCPVKMLTAPTFLNA